MLCKSSTTTPLIKIIITQEQEPTRNCNAKHTQHKIHLHDGPHPEAAQRGGALHDGEMARGVCEVDEVAAGCCAGEEEEGLAEKVLVAAG